MHAGDSDSSGPDDVNSDDSDVDDDSNVDDDSSDDSRDDSRLSKMVARRLQNGGGFEIENPIASPSVAPTPAKRPPPSLSSLTAAHNVAGALAARRRPPPPLPVTAEVVEEARQQARQQQAMSHPGGGSCCGDERARADGFGCDIKATASRRSWSVDLSNGFSGMANGARSKRLAQSSTALSQALCASNQLHWVNYALMRSLAQLLQLPRGTSHPKAPSARQAAICH